MRVPVSILLCVFFAVILCCQHTIASSEHHEEMVKAPSFSPTNIPYVDRDLRGSGGHTSTSSPTMPSAYCASVINTYSNINASETSKCKTCLSNGCVWCDSADYCFSGSSGCSWTVSGDSSACSTTLAGTIVGIILAVILPLCCCACIGGAIVYHMRLRQQNQAMMQSQQAAAYPPPIQYQNNVAYGANGSAVQMQPYGQPQPPQPYPYGQQPQYAQAVPPVVYGQVISKN